MFLKKTASMLAAVLFVATFTAAAPPLVRKDLKVEDLGVPVKARSATISGIVKAPEDGHWHLVVTLEAYSGMEKDPPFLIYDLDLESAKARIVSGVVGRPGPHSPYRHTSGKVYFGQSRPACLISTFTTADGSISTVSLVSFVSATCWRDRAGAQE
jgi:hypothetical protein